jgi:hypothetical protein
MILNDQSLAVLAKSERLLARLLRSEAQTIETGRDRDDAFDFLRRLGRAFNKARFGEPRTLETGERAVEIIYPDAEAFAEAARLRHALANVAREDERAFNGAPHDKARKTL